MHNLLIDIIIISLADWRVQGLVYILTGSLSFFLFILYDINQVTRNYACIRPFFSAGCLLLAYSTVRLPFCSSPGLIFPPAARLFFGISALIFLVLLIYSLFFALPFQKTYLHGAKKGAVYSGGVYALCRHPGVLWFIGFYLFYYLFSGSRLLFWAWLVFSAWNLFYIWLQDRFFFPRLFSGYHLYRESTPFLIPNYQSIRRCLHTLRDGQDGEK